MSSLGFRRGVREAVPIFLPAIPFALVLGVVIAASGIEPWLAWLSSPIAFGGAAQVTLIGLLGEGASVAASVTAALIVSARHLVYSVALAPPFQTQPAWFRWFGPYLLTDQVFALSIAHQRAPEREFRHYYLGVGATFWILWMGWTALGLTLGPRIPARWDLQFAAPLMFMVLLVSVADRWPKLAAAAVAASVTVATAGLPNRTGLLVGTLAGVVFGVVLERRIAR